VARGTGFLALVVSETVDGAVATAARLTLVAEPTVEARHVHISEKLGVENRTRRRTWSARAGLIAAA
jgi:hypothetical protein